MTPLGRVCGSLQTLLPVVGGVGPQFDQREGWLDGLSRHPLAVAGVVSFRRRDLAQFAGKRFGLSGIAGLATERSRRDGWETLSHPA